MGNGRRLLDPGLGFDPQLPNDKAKEAVTSRFRHVLNQIEHQGREPDQWESDQLAYALGLIGSKMNVAASAAVELACAPPAQRSSDTYNQKPLYSRDELLSVLNAL
jgi:hypothetical protein